MKKLTLHLLGLLNEATMEIEKYCLGNSWINEIKAYIKKWTPKLVLEWKQLGAFEIDDQLNKIKIWIESVKSSIEKTIITQNRVLKIDSTSVEKYLVPNLEAIYNEICESVLREINKDVTSFINLMKSILHELKDQPKTIEDFANYAKKVMKYKNNMGSYETRINIIKAFTDVIRINYRALNQEEEQFDTQAQYLWKSFIFAIQESVEFVNTQSPNILEQLDALFQVNKIKYAKDFIFRFQLIL